MKIQNQKNKGFIALVSVLIVGALILTVSVGASLRSIDETTISLGEQESNRALSMANLCAEQALLKLTTIPNYVGNESINVDGQSCDILTVGGVGNTERIIQTQSTVANYTKKIKIDIDQISPTTTISSWVQVSDF